MLNAALVVSLTVFDCADHRCTISAIRARFILGIIVRGKPFSKRTVMNSVPLGTRHPLVRLNSRLGSA